ncbi:MAG: hypothetical protein HS122_13510 [Opitutaceae bacterium]|nr:hypothetical protein [Opitutaceae bacterium]
MAAFFAAGTVMLSRFKSPIRIAVLALAAGACRVPAWQIPETWLARDPGPREVAAIVQTGATESWSAASDLIESQVLALYQREPGRADRLNGWLLAGRWAGLMGESEETFLRRWVDAINRAGVGHAGMQASRVPQDRVIGAALQTDFVSWVLANRRFMEVFFDQLSPCDNLPRVFEILDLLFHAGQDTFAAYSQLALAIALVYDVPPPPGWPHAQVPSGALKRRLPPPLEAFQFFVRSDRQGRCLQRISSLGVGELRFLVDLAAPFEELAWAQANVRTPINRLEETYSEINYRRDRAESGAYVWGEEKYTLPGIRIAGGICVDQAYFATQCAKARGVPCMIFRGAGLDGRHAWFGYLDAGGRWELDAGRLAEQKLVTGMAHNPQTWADLSDHELRFLSEAFRKTPRFRQARIEDGYAQVLLERGNARAAAVAARRSVNFEPRFLAGWETYLAAGEAAFLAPATIEAALREASLAFRQYPDLNQHFSSLLARRLRARGESSAADYQDRLNARKFQAQRADLVYGQATEELSRAAGSEPLSQQMRLFHDIVNQHARGAGVAFLDQVVRPFSTRLAEGGHAREARQAVEYAGRALAAAPGSQLAKEINELGRSLRDFGADGR